MKQIQLLLFLSFLAIESCDFKLTKSLSNESSSNLKESLDNGYFLANFGACNVFINDSIKFKVIESFAERPHRITSYDDHNYLIDYSKFQLVIIIDRKFWDLKGFYYKWNLKEEYLLGDKSISCMFNDTIVPDTISIPVQINDTDSTGNAGKNNNKIIGYFNLIKKGNN